MAVKPVCPVRDYCGRELNKFGGILFSPPIEEGIVRKFHVCIECYGRIKPKS